MDFSSLPRTAQSLERFREEIFQLYIEENRTASEVIALLWQRHNVKVS
jgi:hypothetical protein